MNNRLFSMLCIVFLLTFSSFSVPVFAAEENVKAAMAIPDLLDEEDEELYDEYDEKVDVDVSDPLEPMNRVFFEFNDILYDFVLKPVSDGYSWIFPQELRECFDHFFSNIAEPVRFLNLMLQGRFADSGQTLERFLINSTIGIYGLVDIASLEFDLDLQKADFGQTLGHWGVGSGLYICWPFLGPSTVRDTVGLGVDSYLHPLQYTTGDYRARLGYFAGNRINTLSLNPTLYDDLRRYSLDPYIASRQAYIEYRDALVDLSFPVTE